MDQVMDSTPASHAGMAGTSDQPFEIMKLPKEVRRLILKEYLLMPSPIIYEDIVAPDRGTTKNANRVTFIASFAFGAGVPVAKNRPLQNIIEESRIIRQSDFLKVFLVSRTIYNEAMPTYFGENLFSFYSTESFAKFITSVGPNCRWQLGRAYIFWGGDTSAKAARLLGECFGLRHLTIELPEFHQASCINQAPYEARLLGMKDLLRVRALKSLEVLIPTRLLCSCPRHCRDGYRLTDIAGSEGVAAMIRRLQVLKEPIDPEKIKRQEEVFGETSVLTRSERRKRNAQKDAVTTQGLVATSTWQEKRVA